MEMSYLVIITVIVRVAISVTVVMITPFLCETTTLIPECTPCSCTVNNASWNAIYHAQRQQHYVPCVQTPNKSKWTLSLANPKFSPMHTEYSILLCMHTENIIIEIFVFEIVNEETWYIIYHSPSRILPHILHLFISVMVVSQFYLDYISWNISRNFAV